MKNRIIVIFALFLVFSGFNGEDRVVEQNNVNFRERFFNAGQEIVIINPLRDQMVNEGVDAIFTATVSASNYKVEWFKDDVQIIVGKRHSIFVNGKTSTLLIKNLVPEDTGEYKVVFGNGEATSRAYLAVIISE